MIVAISHDGDDHAAPVLAALERLGATVAVVDTGEFPRAGKIALAYGDAADRWTIETSAGIVRARDVSAVWWRRARALEAAPGLSAFTAGFAVRQATEALAGLAASLRVRWVNDPWREDAASRKPLQLAAAARVGLALPRTLVTNDVERARAFLDARRGTPTIQKALHATPEDWRPTRFIQDGDQADLEALLFTPVILQEHVAGVDIRVTAVGDRLFAAAIDARETRSPQDFRPVFDQARVEPCELPPDVAARLRALLDEFGLAYAAIDLRRRDDGEHVFLEANPSGQWRFVEERTGLPIADELARLLAGR